MEAVENKKEEKKDEFKTFEDIQKFLMTLKSDVKKI